MIENGEQQDICNLITVECVQRSLTLNEVTNFDNMKVEVPEEVDGPTQSMLERCRVVCGRAAGTRAKMRSRVRKEASAQEVRGYYKQFAEAKHLGEHILGLTTKVFDLMDMRNVEAEKLCDRTTWVLTIKTDKQGNFLRTKARWVLRGLQDKQKEYQQTDPPASTRPGFQMSCQMAASKSWKIFLIDLKTAFLQEQSYGVNRDVVCQLPPEAGHHPFFAARLKKPAYGMNDASRRWWNILEKALCSYGMVPTRADRCCYVLYSTQSRERTCNQNNSTQWHDTSNNSTKQRVRTEACAAFENMLDPIAGSPATGKPVAGIINLLVDDIFGTGGTEMEQRVLSRLGQDFRIGSKD